MVGRSRDTFGSHWSRDSGPVTTLLLLLPLSILTQMTHDGINLVLRRLLLIGSGADSNVALDSHDSLVMQSFMCLSDRGTDLVPGSFCG